MTMSLLYAGLFLISAVANLVMVIFIRLALASFDRRISRIETLVGRDGSDNTRCAR